MSIFYLDDLKNNKQRLFMINGILFFQLPVIMKELIKLCMQKKMPCFDPRDVMFITNKWDAIPNNPDDDEEETPHEMTWKTLRSTLEKEWASAREENIFRMSLTEVILFKYFQYLLFEKILK